MPTYINLTGIVADPKGLMKISPGKPSEHGIRQCI